MSSTGLPQQSQQNQVIAHSIGLQQLTRLVAIDGTKRQLKMEDDAVAADIAIEQKEASGDSAEVPPEGVSILSAGNVTYNELPSSAPDSPPSPTSDPPSSEPTRGSPLMSALLGSVLTAGGLGGVYGIVQAFTDDPPPVVDSQKIPPDRRNTIRFVDE